MEKTKKRDRSSNFLHAETELLINLIAAKKHIIENKKSDAPTWQLKDKAWTSIESEFNRISTSTNVYREAKQLKSKYEGLKKDTRKKIAMINENVGVTSAPAIILTPLEKKMKYILSSSAKEDENNSDTKQSDNFDELFVKVEADDPGSEDNSRSSEQNQSAFNVTAEIVHTTPDDPFESIDSDLATTSTSKIENEINEATKPTKWEEWRLASLRARKHPGLSRPSKRNFEKCAKEKYETELVRKKILEEDLEHKKLQNTLLRRELDHKNQLHELQKQHMVLKLEILKAELHNLKKL